MDIIFKYSPMVIALLGFLGTVLGYLLGKKEKNLKLKGVSLDNIDHGLDIYKKIMDTLESNLNLALERLDIAQVSYKKLKEHYALMKDKEAKCQEDKLELQRENLKFYQKLNTCTVNCKLRKKEEK